MPSSTGLTRKQLLAALEILIGECLASSDTKLREDVSILLMGVSAAIGIVDEVNLMLSLKPYVTATIWKMHIQAAEHGDNIPLPPNFPKNPLA